MATSNSSYKVTWDATYDNPNGLAGTYPHFKNFPDFPYIGGTFDTKWGFSNCGKCWRLTNKKGGREIYVTAIDTAGGGFNIGKKAFVTLNAGTVGAGTLDAEAVSVAPGWCGFK